MKIGTLADWFGVGLIEGIRESERCGATGVQVYAWEELNPFHVSASTLAEVKDTARACSQEITALCGELGGHGLQNRADNAEKLAYLEKTIEMALRLDCRVVTTHIGCIPEDRKSARYQTLLEACAKIGKTAGENGVFIAVETGPEPMDRLVSFIKETGTKGLAVNYDPANLVMVTGDDEVSGVSCAGELIVHTHAKDGKCNRRVGPEVVYGVFAEGGIDALRAEDFSTEYPLGQGDVRWKEYLGALKKIGFDGYLTIEREVREDAGKDIRAAVTFLTEMLDEL